MNDYRIERGMNEHAVNAFNRFVETHQSLPPSQELTGLASSILSKSASYLGWENWVFGSANWRFHAKSLVPDGLIKRPPNYTGDRRLMPMNHFSALDDVAVSLLEFCKATLG